jgi:microcystin-dependent protein
MTKKFSLISSYINSNTNNFEYVTTNNLKVTNNAFLKNLNVSGNSIFNNITVNNTITATTFTDGTATLTSGTLSNTLLISSNVFTDGTATLSSGTLSLNELTDGTATLSSGTLSLNELTDGTATLSSGTLSLNELTDGTATLSSGTLSLNELTDGTATLSSGNLTTSGTLSAGLLEGNGVIPIGGIIMWSGTLTDGTVPGSNTNWRLCNGTLYGSVQTPNLSGQFIVGFSTSDTDYQAIGAGTDTEGTAIGQKNVTLTSNEIPAHTHNTFGMDQQLNYFGHEISESGDILRTGQETYVDEGIETIDVSGYTTGTTGSGNSHNNLPPYYILAYIMRIE